MDDSSVDGFVQEPNTEDQEIVDPLPDKPMGVYEDFVVVEDAVENVPFTSSTKDAKTVVIGQNVIANDASRTDVKVTDRAEVNDTAVTSQLEEPKSGVSAARRSTFAEIVTFVKTSRSPSDNGSVPPSLYTGARSLSSPDIASILKKGRFQLEGEGLNPVDPDEIASFVFLHPRDKRYMDGLRRKAIPVRTFALSLALGLGLGSVLAVVLSIVLRVV